jgi:hypothetical protein
MLVAFQRRHIYLRHHWRLQCVSERFNYERVSQKWKFCTQFAVHKRLNTFSRSVKQFEVTDSQLWVVTSYVLQNSFVPFLVGCGVDKESPGSSEVARDIVLPVMLAAVLRDRLMRWVWVVTIIAWFKPTWLWLTGMKCSVPTEWQYSKTCLQSPQELRKEQETLTVVPVERCFIACTVVQMQKDEVRKYFFNFISKWNDSISKILLT